jgi:biopolymer transport protein ExbD
MAKVEAAEPFAFRFAGQFRPKGAGFEIAALIDLGLLVPLFLFVAQSFVVQPAVPLELPKVPFSEGVASRSLVVTLSRENMVFFNDERTTLDGLPLAFREQVFQDPSAVLVIEADERVPYRILIQVYNMAREAGVQKVALATGILGDREGVESP